MFALSAELCIRVVCTTRIYMFVLTVVLCVHFVCTTRAQCPVDILESDRRDCYPWDDLSLTTCEARGCVWCNETGLPVGVPPCYHNDKVCPSTIPPQDRVDCLLPSGGNRIDCLAKSCVWCESLTSGETQGPKCTAARGSFIDVSRDVILRKWHSVLQHRSHSKLFLVTWYCSHDVVHCCTYYVVHWFVCKVVHCCAECVVRWTTFWNAIKSHNCCTLLQISHDMHWCSHYHNLRYKLCVVTCHARVEIGFRKTFNALLSNIQSLQTFSSFKHSMQLAWLEIVFCFVRYFF